MAARIYLFTLEFVVEMIPYGFFLLRDLFNTHSQLENSFTGRFMACSSS